MMGEDAIIVAIVFGSVVSIVFLGVIGSIIKAWVKKDSGDITKNEEFLSALREFKEKTDRRLSNLEAIVADEDHTYDRTRHQRKSKNTEQSGSIEIEMNEESGSDDSSKSGNLRNMLNQ